MNTRFRWLTLGIIAIITWGLLGTGSLYAHTTLTSANPEPDSTVTEELQEIVLTFNTDVDATSTFTLLLDGAEQALGSIEVEGQYVRGVIDQPLPNGDYNVAWRIVGEDGHPIQSEYGFTLSAPEPELAEEPVDEPAEQPAEEPAEEPVQNDANLEPTNEGVTDPAAPDNAGTTENEAPAHESSEEATASANSTWIWVVVGAVVVVALGLVLSRASRRKR
ncbi:copper resistance CopC family protein [Paenibacillus daejeonensis]|uniref:copper resistance CopC family protein n=1 Tax=Paenibacillus daejeonensis TaxID=135193 RepID=UPI0003687600|nr:copper resistance CopC family protein [Paenibacillus daejeonensis]